MVQPEDAITSWPMWQNQYDIMKTDTTIDALFRSPAMLEPGSGSRKQRDSLRKAASYVMVQNRYTLSLFAKSQADTAVAMTTFVAYTVHRKY